MKRLSFYYYNNMDRVGNILSIYYSLCEETWWQRYMCGKPRFPHERMAELKTRNDNRYSYLSVNVDILTHEFNIEIRLRKVGNWVHGRLINEEASKDRWDRIRKRRKM